MRRKKPVEITPYTTAELSELIDLYIFSERDRAILKRHLLDGLLLYELAAEFDYSYSQIKRIVYKAETELFNKILWNTKK